jgi:hypothetical protein
VDGAPRELFLPFRSLAGALSGMRHFGSLPLPSLGVNHLIANGDQAKLILWAARPTKAQLYLGNNVSARDVWGRTVIVETLKTEFGNEQRLTIDKWPIIIDGIDVRVARWRMGITLEDSRIDSLVGQTQELRVRFTNPFPHLVNAQVTVIAKSILAEDTTTNVEFKENSNDVIVLPVRIRPDANTSAASIKLKFAVQGEKPVTFTVDREVQVGTSDFTLDAHYEMLPDNQIRVILDAVNHQSKPISFNCGLEIPNRPRERTQIAGLKDRVTKSILIENASELVGSTLWLKCEQIGTSRILNYRLEIKP